VKTGTCRFCNRSKSLVKSHVIPRSFFHQLRGSAKHLYAGVYREHRPLEYSQSGIWDDEILCCDCEPLFSEWDAYGFEVLHPPPGTNGPIRNDNDLLPFFLRNVDYAKLKLFILGTLWRASVTKHGFFGSIDLGPHELRIADMLRQKNPGTPDEYAVIITRLIGERLDKVIYAPWSTKLRGVHFCILYLPNLKIHIKVDKRPLPEQLSIVALQSRPENIALPIGLRKAEFRYLEMAREIFKKSHLNRT
jgi:hypothetical protein